MICMINMFCNTIKVNLMKNVDFAIILFKGRANFDADFFVPMDSLGDA